MSLCELAKVVAALTTERIYNALFINQVKQKAKIAAYRISLPVKEKLMAFNIYIPPIHSVV